MYLLDTDHESVLIRQNQPAYANLSRRLLQAGPGAVFHSVVSFHEQVFGAHNLIRRARTHATLEQGYDLLRRVLQHYAPLRVVEFNQAAAAEFDRLRSQRVRIGAMDLRIAAIALIRGYTVLTSNARDFSQVPGLTFEDWTA
jgi:tRNA(fMet)-specific endonuclease VapC